MIRRSQGSVDKIIICGFPHCGTSILKTIMGHVPDVYEVSGEAIRVTHQQEVKAEFDRFKFAVCKTPYMLRKDIDYSDYHKIFILRNPKYALSSVMHRFGGKFVFKHTPEEYIRTAETFLRVRDHDDYSCILYEDMFPRDYIVLRRLFDDLGFEYTDTIFDNNSYENDMGIASDSKHIALRQKQINMPFQNMNDDSKICLPDYVMAKLKNSSAVQELYGAEL